MEDEFDPKEAEETMAEQDPDWISGEEEALKGKNGNGNHQLPESPASLNVKFWADGYGVMLTMRSEKVSTLLKQFQEILPFLKNAGYKNVWDKEPITRVLPQEKPPLTQAPICGIHGVPMKWKSGISKSRGTPYAFWACDVRNADNTYCNFKPMAVQKGQEINF